MAKVFIGNFSGNLTFALVLCAFICLVELEVVSGRSINAGWGIANRQESPCSSFCACTYDYNPVCGNDGVSYSNPCGLKCAQKCNPNIFMAHRGECGGSTEPIVNLSR